jgi:hypothetical protein
MILTSVRSISMDTAQSTLALNTVLRLPAAKPRKKEVRTEGLQALSLDLSARLTGYPKAPPPTPAPSSTPSPISPFDHLIAHIFRRIATPSKNVPVAGSRS